MLSITKKISKYNNSEGNNIKFIVMHSTGNGTDTAYANASYFNDRDRQASAHYFVDSSSIYQVVEDSKAAWHCGDGHGVYGITNHNSIGIEMCETAGTITEATINNTIELVKCLMDKYHISSDNVVRHYDASRKCCPEPWSYSNWSKWNEFKLKLKQLSESVTIPKTNKLKAQIQALEYWLNVDYNAKLKHTDGAYLESELYPNLEAVGRLLVKGSKSHVIQWIQQKLEMWGFLKKNSYIPMLLDEITFQAITNLQKKWGRETSGKILISNRTWQIFLEN